MTAYRRASRGARRFGIVAIAAWLLAFASSPAIADEPAAGKTADEGAPDPDKGVEQQFEKAMAIPDKQKVARAEQAVRGMQDVLKRVLEILEEARKDKDVVKLNCVNEKLTAVKGLLRISEQAMTALQEATAKGESESAAHEYTKISIAGDKVMQLRAEAEGCVGELAKYAGETELKVEDPEFLKLRVDRSVPELPPAPPGSPTLKPDAQPPVPPERPPVASPAG